MDRKLHGHINTNGVIMDGITIEIPNDVEVIDLQGDELEEYKALALCEINN
jgi:hypothetical protein